MLVVFAVIPKPCGEACIRRRVASYADCNCMQEAPRCYVRIVQATGQNTGSAPIGVCCPSGPYEIRPIQARFK